MRTLGFKLGRSLMRQNAQAQRLRGAASMCSTARDLLGSSQSDCSVLFGVGSPPQEIPPVDERKNRRADKGQICPKVIKSGLGFPMGLTVCDPKAAKQPGPRILRIGSYISEGDEKIAGHKHKASQEERGID